MLIHRRYLQLLIAFSLLFQPTLQATKKEPSSIPHLALGGGYECVIMISNRTRVPWNGEIFLFRGKGEPWAGGWEVAGSSKTGEAFFSVTLGPLATQKFVLIGDDAIRTGYLQIIQDDSTRGHPEDSLAVSFFYSFKNGKILMDSAGVSVAKSGNAFTFPVERSPTVNTGFAWAPALAGDEGAGDGETQSQSPDLLQATLFDTQGQIFQSRNLPFEGHSAQFFSEVFEAVPSDFLGKVVIKADADFLLTVIRLESTDKGFQLTNVPPEAYPVRESDDDRIIYSQLALGGGYKCVLLISNGSDQEWQGIGTLNQGDSLPWKTQWKVNGTPSSSASSFPLNLGPQSTSKFVLEGNSDVQAGFFRVESEKGYSSSSIALSFFYFFENRGKLVDSTGGPYGEMGNFFSFAVEKTNLIDTGVAWAPSNQLEGTEQPQLRTRLFDSAGNMVEEKTIPFDGHQSRFVSQIFDKVGSSFLGSVQLESDTSFFLTIIRLEQIGSSFQLTSVPPVSEGIGTFRLIGPAGGTVSDGNGASVRVSPGTLANNTLISVSTVEELNTPGGL